MSATQRRSASGNKQLRRQAEVAAEHFLCENLKCVYVRRAVRTQWQKVDFWGCDVMGSTATGSKIYVQVTTGSNSAVSERRRKIEGFAWHPSEKVLLANLVCTESPAKGRRTEYWFRVEEYGHAQIQDALNLRSWHDWKDVIQVPREWFKKAKDEP